MHNVVFLKSKYVHLITIIFCRRYLPTTNQSLYNFTLFYINFNIYIKKKEINMIFIKDKKKIHEKATKLLNKTSKKKY